MIGFSNEVLEAEGTTDEHDGECDCVGCEKTRMGWVGEETT